jgi:hypothetical protein
MSVAAAHGDMVLAAAGGRSRPVPVAVPGAFATPSPAFATPGSTGGARPVTIAPRGSHRSKQGRLHAGRGAV